MPECDTLYRLAARLRPTIAGATVRYARSRDQGELEAPVGETIEVVRAVGKNLLVELTGGWSFHIHLGIGGRCQ